MILEPIFPAWWVYTAIAAFLVGGVTYAHTVEEPRFRYALCLAIVIGSAALITVLAAVQLAQLWLGSPPGCLVWWWHWPQARGRSRGKSAD